MNDISASAHLVKRMLHEEVFYPEHSPRKESAAYAAIHHKLAVVMDLPCLVCGVTNSTLGDPVKNKRKSKAIETHHHVIEWALGNAIDLAKFNTRIVAKLAVSHPGKYGADFTQQEMLDWIDHDPDNLWVLCDRCHRHSLVGIHAVTYPIWGAQDLIRDDFVYTPEEP